MNRGKKQWLAGSGKSIHTIKIKILVRLSIICQINCKCESAALSVQSATAVSAGLVHTVQSYACRAVSHWSQHLSPFSSPILSFLPLQ